MRLKVSVAGLALIALAVGIGVATLIRSPAVRAYFVDLQGHATVNCVEISGFREIIIEGRLRERREVSGARLAVRIIPGKGDGEEWAYHRSEILYFDLPEAGSGQIIPVEVTVPASEILNAVKGAYNVRSDELYAFAMNVYVVDKWGNRISEVKLAGSGIFTPSEVGSSHSPSSSGSASQFRVSEEKKRQYAKAVEEIIASIDRNGYVYAFSSTWYQDSLRQSGMAPICGYEVVGSEVSTFTCYSLGDRTLFRTLSGEEKGDVFIWTMSREDEVSDPSVCGVRQSGYCQWHVGWLVWSAHDNRVHVLFRLKEVAQAVAEGRIPAPKTSEVPVVAGSVLSASAMGVPLGVVLALILGVVGAAGFFLRGKGIRYLALIGLAFAILILVLALAPDSGRAKPEVVQAARANPPPDADAVLQGLDEVQPAAEEPREPSLGPSPPSHQDYAYEWVSVSAKAHSVLGDLRVGVWVLLIPIVALVLAAWRGG